MSPPSSPSSCDVDPVEHVLVPASDETRSPSPPQTSRLKRVSRHRRPRPSHDPSAAAYDNSLQPDPRPVSPNPVALADKSSALPDDPDPESPEEHDSDIDNNDIDNDNDNDDDDDAYNSADDSPDEEDESDFEPSPKKTKTTNNNNNHNKKRKPLAKKPLTTPSRSCPAKIRVSPSSSSALGKRRLGARLPFTSPLAPTSTASARPRSSSTSTSPRPRAAAFRAGLSRHAVIPRLHSYLPRK